MGNVKIHPGGSLHDRIDKNRGPAAGVGGFEIAQRIFQKNNVGGIEVGTEALLQEVSIFS